MLRSGLKLKRGVDLEEERKGVRGEELGAGQSREGAHFVRDIEGVFVAPPVGASS